MKITVVLPEGNIAIGPVATLRMMFLEANDFLKSQSGDAPFFEVSLAGFSTKPIRTEEQFSIIPESNLKDWNGADLLIIPPLFGDPHLFINQNQKLLSWLKEKRKTERLEIAALCKGVFLLAAAGLLDDIACTTHWAEAIRFHKMFPKVKLKSEKIVTDEGGIYTSGGAFSAFNLILYLIEKFAGKASAVWVSKLFSISYDRQSQMPFMIFQNQKSHADERIVEVQDYMENHFEEPLTIKDLARKFAFSQRNFIRRFHAATGNSPIQYLQRLRVEAAKRLLETTQKPVSQIILEAGYNDAKTFREIFRKQTGITPKLYRQKYQMT